MSSNNTPTPDRERCAALADKVVSGYMPDQNDYSLMISCADYVMHEMQRAKEQADIDALMALPAEYPCVDIFFKVLEKAASAADGFPAFDADRRARYDALVEYVKQTKADD
ncbi:MAG: hypothetical protein ACI30W_01130 [Muribaculaceae bacterium]